MNRETEIDGVEIEVEGEINRVLLVIVLGSPFGSLPQTHRHTDTQTHIHTDTHTLGNL